MSIFDTFRAASGFGERVARDGCLGSCRVTEAASPRVAYRGFISYSHRDSRAGAKLHRRLETYKLPGHLIGSETPRGLVPERLTPIFRDREELSAGVSLSAQVQEALAASETLIVLCSPGAKASIWVGKEIETFRALHPERPILAALLEGEPAEAFPAALTEGGAEPIAADLRKGRDGWRLGQQKLIAGMTGVPLDALVQRDAQRQLRRVTAITVGALIAMLVMALLLVAALRARAEADRQRTEAEGLVEYMLTDLRDKLKGVGRLDVMTAVNERAMQHYGAQGDLSSLSPESLNRRARILHAMGEDDESRGQRNRALAKFSEAHRTTEAVLGQKPEDADAIFAHAQSEYYVGYQAYLLHRNSEARKRWQNYATLADRLNRVAPNEKRSIQEIGYAQGNLCSLALEPPIKRQEAQRSCKSALDQMQKLAARSPDDAQVAQDLANRHAWYADALVASGRLAEAIDQRTLQRGILDPLLRRDPQNNEIKFLIAMHAVSAAKIWSEMGNALRKKQHEQEAISLLTALVGADPKNESYRTRLNGIVSKRKD